MRGRNREAGLVARAGECRDHRDGPDEGCWAREGGQVPGRRVYVTQLCDVRLHKKAFKFSSF